MKKFFSLLIGILPATGNCINIPALDTKINKKFNATIIIPDFSDKLINRKILPALLSLTKQGFNGLFLGLIDKTKNKKLNLEKELLKYNKQTAKKFKKLLITKQIDFNNLIDLTQIKKLLEAEKIKRKLKEQRIVYLAGIPETFVPHTKKFIESKIIKPKNLNHIIGYDKPIGKNLKTAKHVIKFIKSKLSKEQIIFTDHYTAKKIISSIPEIISANEILKSCWNNKHIKEINIFMNEKIGVEDRGAFYDKYGVLKDMWQNHMLQVIAFIALATKMPKDLKKAQKARAKIIENLKIEDGFFGQYKNYLKEPGIKKDSKQNTLVNIILSLDTKDWKGVKFKTQIGKKLPEKSSQIQIIFKKTENALSNSTLKIHMSPKQFIELELIYKNKKINLKSPVLSKLSDYDYIFQDMLNQKHNLDVNPKEIEAQWKITENVLKKNLPLKIY